MARGLWKGAISFGLVNVPVELHSAKKRAAELDMTMLDKRDLAPVGYKRVNKSTGKEVAWGDVVKGYEYKDDKYVVLSDEDFRRAFQRDPRQTLKDAEQWGLALSPIEAAALIATDRTLWDRIARELDTRLQKASLSLESQS